MSTYAFFEENYTLFGDQHVTFALPEGSTEPRFAAFGDNLTAFEDTDIYFDDFDIPIIPLVPLGPTTDRADGHGGEKRRRKRPERDLTPVVFEVGQEPNSTLRLTSRGRAVVKAVKQEAVVNEQLQQVPEVAEAIKSPDDEAAQADVARLFALNELSRMLSFEFEALVQRIEQEERDIEALLSMRML